MVELLVADFKWSPITDLTDEEIEVLRTDEFDKLRPVWDDLKEKLEAGGAWDDFILKFNRRWAIETGLVERIYHWEDRGVTETLITAGFDPSLIPRSQDKNPERVAAILEDHQDVLEGLFSFIKQERLLSESYIKELHQALTRNQETVTRRTADGTAVDTPFRSKGSYKTLPNSVQLKDGTHEYCPPEHTASEMENLISFHKRQVQGQIPVDIQAAWLHHRFTQIHPFEDGNGRVARALATLVLIKAGWLPFLVEDGQQKRDYLVALQLADSGSLGPFLVYTRNAQRDAIKIATKTHLANDSGQSLAALIEDVSLTTRSSKQLMHPSLSDLVSMLSAWLDEKLETMVAEIRKTSRDSAYARYNPGDLPIRTGDLPIRSPSGLQAIGSIGYLTVRVGGHFPLKIQIQFHRPSESEDSIVFVTCATDGTPKPPYFEAIVGSTSAQLRERLNVWLDSRIRALIFEWRSQWDV